MNCLLVLGVIVGLFLVAMVFARIVDGPEGGDIWGPGGWDGTDGV